MTHKEIKSYLITRYHLDAATAAEHAKVLMEDHYYIDECPKVFTRQSLTAYLDRMEDMGSK